MLTIIHSSELEEVICKSDVYIKSVQMLLYSIGCRLPELAVQLLTSVFSLVKWGY